MKLPTDKDPTIPSNIDKINTNPKPSHLNKNNQSTQSVKDSPNAFKGETQIDNISISQHQITEENRNQKELLIQADSLITQNHNKISKIISSYILFS